MQGKLLLFDAMNVIRRVYAALTSQQADRDALERTAEQVTRLSTSLIQQQHATHALFVFDGSQPGWRKRCFAGYKASRSAMPGALQQGLDTIQEQLWRHGIDSLLPEEDEADDLIASLVHKSTPHIDTVIVSTDHGYYPLLDAGVSQWHPFNRNWLDLAYYRRKFQIRADQYTDYQALAGNSGLSIGGVPGIGPKTASDLLEQFNSIDGIYAALPQLPDKLRTRLQQAQPQLAIFRQICALKSDCELGFSLQQLRVVQATDRMRNR